MRRYMVACTLVLVLLSACSIHSGIERLGTIGDPELLPERVKPVALYQVTSKGSNGPKITVLATHECDFRFETVPVIVEHVQNGVPVKYRDHRVTEIYDCGVNTLAFGTEGSTKSQMLNLGKTAIEAGAFAGGMRLRRPDRYNSNTALSGGSMSSGDTSVTTTASPSATSAGATASTGPVSAEGGGGGSTTLGDVISEGGTVSGDVSQSNDIVGQ